MLMNSGQVADQIRKSKWMKTLRGMKQDDAVVREAFLRILARQPTAEEQARYRQLLGEGKRDEAIDDLVWVLVNSAEFLTKT